MTIILCERQRSPGALPRGKTFGFQEGYRSLPAYVRAPAAAPEPRRCKALPTTPNIAPYIDDIYAYLQARSDGVLGRGRPARLGQ